MSLLLMIQVPLILSRRPIHRPMKPVASLPGLVSSRIVSPCLVKGLVVSVLGKPVLAVNIVPPTRSFLRLEAYRVNAVSALQCAAFET